MKANDHYQYADIEIELAGYLAEAESRDPEAVRIIENVMGLHVDYDAVDLYMEGMVDGALDRIAEREAPPPRPRTPIEMMVDEACGVPWSNR